MSELKHSAQHETPSVNIAAQIEQRRIGRRTKVFHGGTLCSKCYAAPPAKSQRYCSKCHVNAVMASRARTLARKGAE